MDRKYQFGKISRPRSWGIRPRGEGQAITEFALILPILLLMIFGIFELARLFQAYLVIVNAARFGVRYAVTGEYNPDYCIDTADGPDKHGKDGACAGADKNAEEDAARLQSIYDEVNNTAVAISRRTGVTSDVPGYFRITVCSSRTGFSYNRTDGRCYYDADPNDGVPPMEKDDPGNPGEGTTRVLVAVNFNHPLILPFLSNVWQMAPLHSERTGILEQFRVARVLGLPPDIYIPTSTPQPPPTDTPIPTATETPVPTDTPTMTPTSTATNTPTFTPTDTATSTPTFTPTPTASCDFLGTDPFYFYTNNGSNEHGIQLPLDNLTGAYDITITNVRIEWGGAWHDYGANTFPTGQQSFKFLRFMDNPILPDPSDLTLVLGQGLDYSQPANVLLKAGEQDQGLMAVFLRSFTQYTLYFHLSDFVFSLDYKVGDKTCSKTIQGRDGPIVQANMPPDPITGPIRIGATASDTETAISRVFFEVLNSSGVTVYTYQDFDSPYCLNGETNGQCDAINPYGNWPGNSIPIKNGETYSLLVQARDTDRTAPAQQYTRVRTAFRLNVPPPTATPQACSPRGRGLEGDYSPWAGKTATFPSGDPALVRIDPTIDFNWKSSSPGQSIPNNKFVTRWHGQVMPSYPGQTVTFYTRTDDGVRLWVNGQQLINKWASQNSTENSATIALANCEEYPIVMEYYENTGNARAELRWSSEMWGKQIIPSVNLYPPNNGGRPTSTVMPTLEPTDTLEPPTPTPVTPTRTPRPTATYTPTPTMTPTATPVTPTATHTKGPNPTNTPRPPTSAPTKTPTPEPIPPTKTPTKTATMPWGG